MKIFVAFCVLFTLIYQAVGQENCDTNNPNLKTFICVNNGASYQVCLFPGNIMRNCPVNTECSEELRSCVLIPTTTTIATTTSEATLSTTTAPQTFRFRCTGKGYFPDPFVCTQYHLCSAADTESTVFSCPSNYVFNSQYNLCRRAIPCSTVNCLANPGQPLKQYSARLQYWVGCDTSPASIARCSTGAYFDETTGRCYYRCPREGDNADSENPNGYFRCYYSANILISKHYVCPFNLIYSATLQLCVQP